MAPHDGATRFDAAAKSLATLDFVHIGVPRALWVAWQVAPHSMDPQSLFADGLSDHALIRGCLKRTAARGTGAPVLPSAVAGSALFEVALHATLSAARVEDIRCVEVRRTAMNMCMHAVGSSLLRPPVPGQPLREGAPEHMRRVHVLRALARHMFTGNQSAIDRLVRTCEGASEHVVLSDGQWFFRDSAGFDAA